MATETAVCGLPMRSHDVEELQGDGTGQYERQVLVAAQNGGKFVCREEIDDPLRHLQGLCARVGVDILQFRRDVWFLQLRLAASELAQTGSCSMQLPFGHRSFTGPNPNNAGTRMESDLEPLPPELWLRMTADPSIDRQAAPFVNEVQTALNIIDANRDKIRGPKARMPRTVRRPGGGTATNYRNVRLGKHHWKRRIKAAEHDVGFHEGSAPKKAASANDRLRKARAELSRIEQAERESSQAEERRITAARELQAVLAEKLKPENHWPLLGDNNAASQRWYPRLPHEAS